MKDEGRTDNTCSSHACAAGTRCTEDRRRCVLSLMIRKGEAADAETLTRFNIAMAHETEGKLLDRDTVAAGVRRLLENPRAGFYLVVENDNRVTGALMVTFEWSDWRDGCFWWLQSVYVDPPHRRRGVFRRLFTALKSLAAAEQDVCGLRLYVAHNNDVAQMTYERLGMTATHYAVYEQEFD